LSHDPAWEMPERNWRPQSSFESPIAIPADAPDGGVLVCIPPLNRDWLPIILGCLDMLLNDSTWIAADDAAMSQVLTWVDLLKEMVMTSGPCCDVEMRLQDSCVLQFSKDGGDTWIDVTGWADNFGPCVTSIVVPPTPPPTPPPDPPVQGCNIAGYIAHYLIRQTIAKAILAIESDQQVIQWGIDIIGLIPGAGFLINYLIHALQDLYNSMVGGTLSHYQDAVADSTLWSKITCAIYAAIATDGEVTDANFAAIETGLAAVSYVHPDVMTAIEDYVHSLGAEGLKKLQTAGIMMTYDCSGCGTGDSSGPPGVDSTRDAGTVTLTILSGTPAITVDVVFNWPFPSPPVVVCTSDSQLLIASASDITETDFQLSITAAFDVDADVTATVSWAAVLPGFL